MTRVRTFDFAFAARALVCALMLAAGLMVATSAWAQGASAVAQARAAGQVGEQADGYLGYPTGASPSADLRSRVDQINIQRRALYTRRAEERSVSVNEMAAAVACEIFGGRIATGEKYRGEDNQWRTHAAAGDIVMPSFCPH